MLPLLLASALAAPRTDLAVEDAKKLPGLVVIEVGKPGACGEAWASAEVVAWEGAHPGATFVVAPFTKGSVEALLGDVRTAAVTKVAFRDGVEVDRACGCLDGAALAGWLEIVATGGTRALAQRSSLELAPDLDTTGWLELVQLEACAARLPEAFAAARHLWDVIPTEAPDQREVRLTRVAHDLGMLAAKDPASRAQLVEMRDALADGKDTDRATLDAWVALNRVLGEDDATLAWFDASRGRADRKALVEAHAPNVFYLLVEKGRWADAGMLIDDVRAWLDLWKAQKAGLDTSTWGYAALRAAGRDKEAAQLAKSVLKVAPEGTACQLLAKSTEVGAASRAEAAVAKDCSDDAVLDAWSAAAGSK